jgi:hypothetical protein
LLAAVPLALIQTNAKAQTELSGIVYDSSGKTPLEAVSVLGSSGQGTVTDVNGRYHIKLNEKDSVWFSYLGRSTQKYPAWVVLSLSEFDVTLQVNVPVLKEVKVLTHDYKEDSVQNRMDYAKVFNYKKPSLGSIITSFSPLGITVDIDELIRAFQKKKMRTQLQFQRRLIEEEHNKFIDHRFTKTLVKKLTGLDGESLHEFIVRYRPGYLFTVSSSDYDFRAYILDCLRKYKVPGMKDRSQ